jgi:hypothetical protein
MKPNPNFERALYCIMLAVERQSVDLAERIQSVKSKLEEAAVVDRELSLKIAFEQRQLAFQERVTSLTRARIHGQVQSTAMQTHTRKQAVTSAGIMATSVASQSKADRLQATMADELERRASRAALRREELAEEERRIERALSHKLQLLRTRKKAAALCEALLDEREATSDTDHARARRARRREKQSKRRHFGALLASADAVLDAEARRAESTSVQPSPRHALDPDEAYAAACRLLVPVELWPEFCLTVLVGGQRAAQVPVI